MEFVVSTEQMKIAEGNSDRAGVSYLRLMENAGEACFKRICGIVGSVEGKNVVVLSGRGNNGGDGIVIAKEIIRAGGNALVVFAVDLPNTTCSRECYNQYEQELKTIVYTHREDSVKTAISKADIIIDCVFGTGFHGTLEPKISALFGFINACCHGFKISIDVPSGCNSDTGEIAENAFKPDVTLTLGAVKKGLLSHGCFEFCGSIVLVDIGINEKCYLRCEAVISDRTLLEFIPERPVSSHKGTYGRLLNISGSGRYTGAALLSTKAALRTGAGLCTLATPMRVVNAIACAIPEATFLPLHQDDECFITEDVSEQFAEELKKATAVSIGCGLGNTDASRITTEYVIKNADCPVIIDADGINSLSSDINVLKDNNGRVIITPHPAEFSRITGKTTEEIQKDRLTLAKSFAAEYGVTVVLKGVNTVIASPDGMCMVNSTGNAGLAKGGSGDVLTGIIASLAAQGTEPFFAAALGVYLHGLAADELAKKTSLAGMLPSDIAEILPFLMKV